MAAAALRTGIDANIASGTPSYLTRVLRLAFLDPVIIQMILDGSAPVSLTAKRLTQPGAIVICWHEQRRTMGIAPRR